MPLTDAVISADDKNLVGNLDKKAEVVEGSGSYPTKGTELRSDPQSRPDAEFNSSGASPDDEDGDVNEGSGEVEGSGAVPANVVLTTRSTTILSTTTSTPATPITTAKPRHQFNEERRVHMDDESDLVQAQTTTLRTPVFTQGTTTTRQTPLTVVTRPPPTPTYGSESDFEMLKPGILAAVSGGAVVGILMTILLVMFIVYRMRKKDEGSYSLDEPHPPPNYSYAYQKASTKEFYA